MGLCLVVEFQRVPIGDWYAMASDFSLLSASLEMSRGRISWRSARQGT